MKERSKNDGLRDDEMDQQGNSGHRYDLVCGKRYKRKERMKKEYAE